VHFVTLISRFLHPSPRTEGKRLKLFPDLTDQTNTNTLHSNEYGFFVTPADVSSWQHSSALRVVLQWMSRDGHSDGQTQRHG